jgi:hypothetical protein
VTQLKPAEAERFLELLPILEQIQAARDHPADLIRHMKAFDERAAVEFEFNMDDQHVPWNWFDLQGEPYTGGPWGWQRGAVDFAMLHDRTIFLKARQIGVTWIFCGVGVWYALMRPGSRSLYYRQREDDAIDLVRRSWYLLQSLPEHFWGGCEVTKPTKGATPSTEIELTFPDGKISRIVGMTSAASSGHGQTGAFVLLDEFSRIDRAGEIVKAVSSVAGEDGKMVMVSTANGVSNAQTGEGNVFHRQWVQADHNKIHRAFLPWHMHPDRDQSWYDNSAETQMLLPHERAEQYPENPDEAFTFSQAHYFDGDAMHWYASHAVRQPEFKGDFTPVTPRQARFVRRDSGMTSVYQTPEKGHRYVIGADVATGQGLDFSAAFVIDLENMAICAEFNGKLDSDQFEYQLYYLGLWFNTARVAIEDAGGYGNPVIVGMRDGTQGRPHYPAMYKHRSWVRPDMPVTPRYGFPMTRQTRPQVLEHMEGCLRERALPWITPGLMSEITTFIRYNPNKPEQGGAWPRAQEGCNDDRVMSCAIALELYRERGDHPLKPKRKAVSMYRDRFKKAA